jgi:hypothetical protein
MTMWELFARDPKALILLVGILCGTLIAIVAIIAYHWGAVRQAESETSLKQDMLQRGLSVDDMERVLKANSHPVAPEKNETVTEYEYALIEKLIDEGKSAEDIERVLRACRGKTTSTESTEKDVERILAERANAAMRDA